MESQHSYIQCGQWKIIGKSIGGQETYIVIPNINFCFDMGTSTEAITCETVCISHGHADHIGSLHNHARLRKLKSYSSTHSLVFTLTISSVPTYILPSTCVKPFQQLYSSCLCLDNGLEELKEVPKEYNLITATVGFEMPLKRGNLFLRALETHHIIPSLGYCLFSKKKKLKPEFASLSKQEIIQKKKDRVEIEDDVEVPEIAFTGDTLLESVVTQHFFTHANILIMECTFVDDSVTQAQAHEYFHVHLKDIVDHQDKFHNQHIILGHFSARYKRKDIVDAFENSAVSSELKKKVHLLLEGFE